MTYDWTAAGAVGQWASAAITLVGFLFVVRQIGIASKTADLQALQEFVRSATEREACLLGADSDQSKQQAFIEFLNFLEMNAAALNGNLFPRTTRSIAVDKLCTSIVVIQEAPSWHKQFSQAVTASTTFAELAKFMKGQRKSIAARAAEFRLIPGNSS
ncbi:MAG: hypothetical protein FJX45_12655 [Alphaproteobacteria bacterium]|nr:hypothetical protein [Alphaproteobacteria bacterium]MBM3651342.1 hypothetical protein [Alphaproteobacteria bacterium]